MKLKEIFLSAMLCLIFTLGQNVLAQANAEEQVSEEELVAAAELMLAQEAKDAKGTNLEATSVKVENTDTVTEKIVSEGKKESETPAFKNVEAAKSVQESSWKRMALSAALVLMLGVGLFYGVQRFARKGSTQNQKLRMDVLSQHHFSPKRSLIVVRVAGEHLLIGATDHSMNLIKSISLIDDEVEKGEFPQDFNNFLEDDFVEQSLGDSKKRRTFTV